MSDRIDHVSASREWLVAAERPDISLDETTAFADIAQAHATLALVEQQRIANLIALGGEGWENNEAIRAILLTGDKLRPEIRKALGV